MQAPYATLHYIYDPLCGWCYGASPLVSAAADIPGLTLTLHGGGMMTGANRQAVTDSLRQYVMQHDQRIASITGQPFGTAYFDGLLKDRTAVLDSAPPIAAILAAAAMGLPAHVMLARIQKAHYVEGRRIADGPILIELAESLGLDTEAFAEQFAAYQGAQTAAHTSASRQWLTRTGRQGFPTFVLERNGQFSVLEPSHYLGQQQAWQAHLTKLIH
ncbi:DsbA family protein [Chitinivorax sp. B]|uniref:DsbA family protein n=1 Tax=Chitinivorax sp. B TaxID=2502235 RepID=UPI0010F9D1B0|nr:DsbA family protein [Chitinivorax sp. B]